MLLEMYSKYYDTNDSSKELTELFWKIVVNQTNDTFMILNGQMNKCQILKTSTNFQMNLNLHVDSN